MNVESAPSHSQHFHPEPGPAAGLVIYLHATRMGDEVGLDNTGISINTCSRRVPLALGAIKRCTLSLWVALCSPTNCFWTSVLCFGPWQTKNSSSGWWTWASANLLRLPSIKAVSFDRRHPPPSLLPKQGMRWKVQLDIVKSVYQPIHLCGSTRC